VLANFETYYRLLLKWNATINLTALQLDDAPSGTLDRLFVESMAASRWVSPGISRWIDLGSGAGSPALPMQIVLARSPVGNPHLTMVESRGRKAAFLREAVRVLDLRDTKVENARVEAVAAKLQAQADLVTVRAVRIDAPLLSSAQQLLRPSGLLMIFHSAAHVALPGWQLEQSIQLLSDQPARLAILRLDVSRETSPRR
jgi:16S rRNA (guanine527-N7)-methyltransferase